MDGSLLNSTQCANRVCKSRGVDNVDQNTLCSTNPSRGWLEETGMEETGADCIQGDCDCGISEPNVNSPVDDFTPNTEDLYSQRQGVYGDAGPRKPDGEDLNSDINPNVEVIFVTILYN